MLHHYQHAATQDLNPDHLLLSIICVKHTQTPAAVCELGAEPRLSLHWPAAVVTSELDPDPSELSAPLLTPLKKSQANIVRTFLHSEDTLCGPRLEAGLVWCWTIRLTNKASPFLPACLPQSWTSLWSPFNSSSTSLLCSAFSFWTSWSWSLSTNRHWWKISHGATFNVRWLWGLSQGSLYLQGLNLGQCQCRYKWAWMTHI